MSQINTTFARAQLSLARINSQMQTTMERLSTGLRINRASDDPGGLVASELLGNTAQAIDPAIESMQRASSMLATADGAIGQVSDLLLSIQQLVVASANSAALSDEEIAANQMQIDAAITSIQRISQSTTFSGRRLLDGSLDYVTANVDPAAITDATISRAALSPFNTTPVQVDVSATAESADLIYATSQTGAVTLRISGSLGTKSAEIPDGATASSIVLIVNQLAYDTGVRASFINSANPASGVRFTSDEVGSAAFVSIDATSGSFATTDLSGTASTRDNGADAAATINGVAAHAVGNTVQVSSSSLQMTLTLTAGFTGQSQFAINGGGALFITGTSIESDVLTFSIQSVDPARLGQAGLGFLSQLASSGVYSLASGHLVGAASIVNAAVEQAAQLRGRIGSLAKESLDRGLDSLNQLQTQIDSAQASIRDADFAVETAALSRAQILQQVVTSVMATANSSNDTVLRLLS